MQRCFHPNVITFQSNCAESLHFSAFCCDSIFAIVIYIYIYMYIYIYIHTMYVYFTVNLEIFMYPFFGLLNIRHI